MRANECSKGKGRWKTSSSVPKKIATIFHRFISTQMSNRSGAQPRNRLSHVTVSRRMEYSCAEKNNLRFYHRCSGGTIPFISIKYLFLESHQDDRQRLSWKNFISFLHLRWVKTTEEYCEVSTMKNCIDDQGRDDFICLKENQKKAWFFLFSILRFDPTKRWDWLFDTNSQFVEIVYFFAFLFYSTLHTVKMMNVKLIYGILM